MIIPYSFSKTSLKSTNCPSPKLGKDNSSKIVENSTKLEKKDSSKFGKIDSPRFEKTHSPVFGQGGTSFRLGN